MTITRLGQLTAETRVITDVDLAYASNAPSVSSAQARTGTYSYLQSAVSNPPLMGIIVPTPTTAYRCGFWLRHAGLGSNNNGALYIASNGKTPYESTMIGVNVRGTASELAIVRPASGTINAFETLASVAVPASLASINTWIHVGITHKIAETEGFLSVYINGVRVLTHTGDTRLFGQGSGVNAYAATASGLYVGGGSIDNGLGRLVHPTYMDDAFFDSYVGEADAPVPARRFDVMLPTGAGANAEWTPLSSTNVSNVDDNVPDDDTTYNKALAADLDDTYVYSDVTVPTDHRIVAVIPTIFAKRLDSEIASTVKALAWDGATMAESAELSLPMDYSIPVFARFTTAPDGSAWSEADANAAEFGIRSSGTF